MNRTKLSKTVSYILRHHPEDFDLKLAADASVKTDELLAALQRKFKGITKADLIELVKNDDKGRFSFLEGRKRIRANYGHSIEGVNPDYQAVKPPAILYHGTRPEVQAKIMNVGLKPMGRNYVHLSVGVKEAEKVAVRRTNQPVIFKIEALKAHHDGQNFYKTAEDIYLTDQLSADYLSLNICS
ncbi:RNA 2'-phosphotransferase [Halanaerobium congolense]|jgi:putative RNA 2'-phosphotransferase|uniref:Probable RNA 2'-phosphotransferase n=1 Tax=Halanaerobium congolense TaxID=54121 RepID=A0A4R8GIP1_9FIRM|nr:RNA 2'-phosphotransferase [Halanaerobium congolense]TDS29805.1 putative RNA 2'-phosphotransferase [Halanaerobium congolense]TDX45462.1 putative RNA 2'-phosphotransferase [Halanaerobium congolense]SDH12771.1 putative RNA 2'-phosphotransferase [Halanaerobium congolense]SDK54176.1 putative RNA 2'-phosphotransferase [Halanaerobium congolense]SDM15233.1 putative RNA 2'-phosphotransferase [Halanaerobium congolense]